jgi:hypothetical protein
MNVIDGILHSYCMAHLSQTSEHQSLSALLGLSRNKSTKNLLSNLQSPGFSRNICTRPAWRAGSPQRYERHSRFTFDNFTKDIQEEQRCTAQYHCSRDDLCTARQSNHWRVNSSHNWPQWSQRWRGMYSLMYSWLCQADDHTLNSLRLLPYLSDSLSNTSFREKDSAKALTAITAFLSLVIYLPVSMHQVIIPFI